jgi:hypothetical protein
MFYRLAADLVLILHGAFVAFVVLGGLFCLRWPATALLQLPAAIWGVGIELTGGICPLTPLENRLRRLAGEQGFEGGFVENYLLSALYPEGLTREVQMMLAGAAILFNVAIYSWVLVRRGRRDR